MPLADIEKRQLDEVGFLVLDGFMPPGLVLRLRERVEQLYVEEGDAAGAEFKPEPGCVRLANLVDKGDVFREVVSLPLQYVQHVLGEVKLSSLNARSVPPGGAGSQPLHADMSAVADERGYWVCNTVWMLDDFTAENGALRVVPGSHRWRSVAQGRPGGPASGPSRPGAGDGTGRKRGGDQRPYLACRHGQPRRPAA